MIDSEQIKNGFDKQFGTTPDIIVKSPGRINIIGEHTDYNNGFVLPAAIDKEICIGVSKRNDNSIHMYAADFDQHFEIEIDALQPTEIGWPNYVMGVVDQIRKRGFALSGFTIYIDGDVPLGSGLSSSAALEVAVAFALNELFSLGLERVELAKIGQLAEHTYAGVKCGIMDQFASVLGREGHALLLDCRDLSYQYTPLDLIDYEILLLNTNVKHSLASSAYNDRRAACEQGVAWIQEVLPEVKSLRDATVAMLDEYVEQRDKDIYTKCRFVVEENQRVMDAVEALRNNNIERLGQLMIEAHWALSKEYEVSCDELDFLVDAVQRRSDVVGARMMGGGFGGCTINIVKKGAVNQLIDEISPVYREKFGWDLTPIYVKLSGGSEIKN